MNGKSAASPSPAGDVRLHHLGFVVSSIEKAADSFARSLAATWDHKIFFDPIQKVRVAFFQGSNGADPLMELVEPDEGGSPVSRFLERGGGLHHLCYEVEDLESHLKLAKSAGNVIIRPPVPAVAFGGRRIAWGITKNKLLVEFLERYANGDLQIACTKPDLRASGAMDYRHVPWTAEPGGAS